MVKSLYITKALVRCRGKYLLLRKVKDMVPENNGKWECPGGKIHDGEDPQDAILREVKEETGFNCEIISELPILYMRNGEWDSVCRVYLLETRADQVKLSNEHSEYKWVKPEEVKNMKLVMFADLLLKYFNNVKEYGL